MFQPAEDGIGLGRASNNKVVVAIISITELINDQMSYTYRGRGLPFGFPFVV